MVKKASGKWMMYVNYTDLNNACPKNLYPLPSIDQLVDGVTDHSMLSFQMRIWDTIKYMVETNKLKTAFITKEANYYYEVMPLGLKNVGATYGLGTEFSNI